MKQYERDESDTASLEPILLELTATPRSREITEADLPAAFVFPGDILAYGQRLVTRGVEHLRQTGQVTESLFEIGIDPATSAFVRVTGATDPSKTTRASMAEDITAFSAHRGIGLRTQLFFRAAKMFLGGHQLAHVAALEAHTHAPHHALPTLEGKGLAPEVVRALELPLLAAFPSFSDVYSLGIQHWRVGSMVLTPGVTFVMVGTDQTPRYAEREVSTMVRQYDGLLDEQARLAGDYWVTWQGEPISPRLEAAYRELYAGKLPASTPADVLRWHNVTYAMAGAPDAALFNPVAHRQLADLRHCLEALHCVGYYNLTAAGDYTFVRFTQDGFGVR